MEPLIKNPPPFVKTARDNRLWKEAKKQAKDEYPEIERSDPDRFWSIVTGIFYRMKERRGGERDNPSSRAHCQEFHGLGACDTYSDGRMWVPGGLVEMGRAVSFGYGIMNPRSSKDHRQRYIHDFHGGVKAYRRARRGERADVAYKSFPKELMVLGWLTEFTYVCPDSGDNIEIKGSQRKKTAATRKILVVIGGSGVEYVLKGGKMRVDDWIYK